VNADGTANANRSNAFDDLRVPRHGRQYTLHPDVNKTAISLFMAVCVTRRGNRSAAALSFSCE
jgi:hypothetical protein